ncbi:ABC transporter ATP-binding protein [Chloroflexota bacterium]
MLSIRNIMVNYNAVVAVKDISIEVDEREVVTLIGSNGAGKSTILKTISGLKPPTSGEIWFLGKKISGLSPTEIVKMGIAHVPEGRRIFPYMTVLENLKMGAYIRRDREDVKQDLERYFELIPILKQRSKQQGGTLSGGEQQMLAVARALMAKPRLILMDEPSLGLAPMVVAEIGELIKSINAAGTAIILVEQNARMALRIAKRGYLLETGSIVIEGNADDLARNEQVKRVYLGG